MLATLALALLLQTQASLGVGVGTVRYSGGSSFSTGSIFSGIQGLSPNRFASLSGAAALLAGGEWAAQGRTDLWAATPAHSGPLRFAVGGALGGTTRTDGGTTAAGSAVAEFLFLGSRAGVALGAGPAFGAIRGEETVTALRLRGRAWWQAAGADYAVTVEPQRFLGAWFTDVVAGVTLERRRVTASLWATARVSDAYGSKATASGALQVFVTPHVALDVTGGGYLSDPYQGFPRGGFFTAGLRVQLRARGPRAGAAPRWPPLVPERRADSVVVRFRMPGAGAVAIAGDWNNWTPLQLRRVADAVWEGALVLAPGTYRFNLLVDGREWVVPGGVAVVPDGMGGLVAILVIP